MNFTPLNADVETQKGAIEGQGSGNPLVPRGLNRDKAKNPNETSFDMIREKLGLYARVITPEEIQQARVISQITGSQSSDPLSSQLNNRIDVTLVHTQVKGGDRITI